MDATKERLDFIKGVLEIHKEQNRILDSKGSFLLGISGAILSLSLGQFFGTGHYNSKLGLVFIVLTSLISCILSISIIKFPFRDKQHRKHLMFYKAFGKMSENKYLDAIMSLRNEKDFLRQYIEEIYDMREHTLEIRYRLVKYAGFVLMSGLIVGTALLFLMQ